MPAGISRAKVFPEASLPDARGLLAAGRKRAEGLPKADCAFLRDRGVASERAYKERMAADGAPMFHAQAGWRDPDVTARNMAEMVARVAVRGGRVDRFGLCLDWSMGYPPDERENRARGTGLILRSDDDFRLLAEASTAAPHFGDFVIGMPAAAENAQAALRAGATSVGNIGQYFTFRLPDWDDDVEITARSVEALAMCAAHSADVIVHSNVDDGFAARFSDLACALGAVLLERHIVEDLIGGRIGHCYGHTFSDLAVRQAFHLALGSGANGPGTMIYGNTTRYGADATANWAVLAGYLSADLAALRWMPSGHAVTPIPITEAERIPNTDEIVDVQVFAARLAERIDGTIAPGPPQSVAAAARTLEQGARTFFDNVMDGLRAAGIDTGSAFEMLLSLRRIGAPALERTFGPGADDGTGYYGRAPLVASSVVDEIAELAEEIVSGLDPALRETLRERRPKICIATTDVHEYGKRLVEQVLSVLDIEIIDGGIGVDADDLVATAAENGCDVIAISTYNGVAADFVERLSGELAVQEVSARVFVGGRLNAVPDGSNTGLPVDVVEAIGKSGAQACARVEDMLTALATLEGE